MKGIVSLGDTSYVSCVWVFDIPDQPGSDKNPIGDCLLTLFRAAPDDAWTSTIRFRWYVDDKLWPESKDRKTVVQGDIDASVPEPEAIARCEHIMQGLLGLLHGRNLAMFKIHGGIDALVNALSRDPRFHMSTITIEEQKGE